MRLGPTTTGAVTVVLAVTSMTACASDERSAVADTSVASTAAPTTSAPTTTAGTVVETTEATSTTATPSTTAAVGPAVFDFLAPVSADGWSVINDTVMGGVSNGQLTWADGVLTFAGDLSLENNGGFASIRSPEVDPQTATEWAGRDGVRVEVDGDGRSWKVELRTDGTSGGWVGSFTTQTDGPTVVELPWSSFEPVTRFLEPRQTTDVLDPAGIATVAFFLVDGVAGPFRLGLRSIG